MCRRVVRARRSRCSVWPATVAFPRPGTALALSRREVLAAGQVLGRIGAVEVGEGMPHPIIEGAWNKISEAATYPYFILEGLRPDNMTGFAQMAEEVGFAAALQEHRMGRARPRRISRSMRDLGRQRHDVCVTTIDKLASDHKIGLGTHTLSQLGAEDGGSYGPRVTGTVSPTGPKRSWVRSSPSELGRRSG